MVVWDPVGIGVDATTDPDISGLYSSNRTIPAGRYTIAIVYVWRYLGSLGSHPRRLATGRIALTISSGITRLGESWSAESAIVGGFFLNIRYNLSRHSMYGTRHLQVPQPQTPSNTLLQGTTGALGAETGAKSLSTYSIPGPGFLSITNVGVNVGWLKMWLHIFHTWMAVVSLWWILWTIPDVETPTRNPSLVEVFCTSHMVTRVLQ